MLGLSAFCVRFREGKKAGLGRSGVRKVVRWREVLNMAEGGNVPLQLRVPVCALILSCYLLLSSSVTPSFLFKHK